MRKFSRSYCVYHATRKAVVATEAVGRVSRPGDGSRERGRRREDDFRVYRATRRLCRAQASREEQQRRDTAQHPFLLCIYQVYTTAVQTSLAPPPTIFVMYAHAQIHMGAAWYMSTRSAAATVSLLLSRFSSKSPEPHSTCERSVLLFNLLWSYVSPADSIAR